LAGRHDEVLRRTFDETVPCDRLGLSLLVLLRLAKDGLHRALLPDALVEALTSPTLIEAEDDRLLDALCRLAGVPGIAGAVRGDALRPGTLGSYRRVAARPAAGAALRVRVIGNLQEDGGLHRNLENSLDALRRAGIAAELVDARVLPAATHLDAAERLVNLFHVSPAALPGFLGLERPDLVAPAYNIGYFMWETEDLPRSFDLGLECVDEVWTGSEFCRAAFARRFSGPVVNMSHAVELPALARPLPRAHFGLPEAAFCFYFAFDAKALFGRKNPLLVARAFRQAFPADEPVVLAIKIRNPDEAGRDPRNRPYWKALRALAAVDGRIRIIAQDFPAAEMRALLETADCYVSLHRAEGFGYTLAEAMLAGKPVIASRYSGNLDFMNDGNALLVDGALSFIRAGDGFGDPGARWFDADPDEAARLMRLVLADPEGARARAAAGQAHVRRDLSPAALGERYARRLGEILKERP
jgi:glycosyltransferase involved in cell wall biosynthesis